MARYTLPTTDTAIATTQKVPSISAAVEFVPDRGVEQIFGIPKNTLQAWRQTEKGPPYHRIGRKILYRVEEVREFLARHRYTPIRSHAA